MKKIRPKTSFLLASAALAMHSTTANALDLMQAWQSALTNDKEYAVAQAGYGVMEPKQHQAEALWRPNVYLNGTVGAGYLDSRTEGGQFSTPTFGRSNGVDFNTSINTGLTNRIALTASQPLYDPKRRAEQQQLIKSADLTKLEWQAARQSLMLKVAQQYFDVAVAQRALEVTQKQTSAVQKIAVEMHDRFNIGTSPITDTHEADARLSSMQAMQLSAEMDLQNKKNLLADSTGLPAESLTALLPQNVSNEAKARPLDSWMNDGAAGNFQVRMSEVTAAVATEEAKKYAFASTVKVDAIAQAARDQLDGHGSYGSSETRQTNAVVGVQVSVPLFTGGYRDAKQAEAMQLVTKAKAETERNRQLAVQQIRQTYLNLTTDESRLKALQQTLEANKLRLDATRLGRQIGDRTTLDVLNAENEVANAELNVVLARVNLLMNQLHLEALSGKLDENVLSSINSKLTIQQ
ncbi:MAG TPA: TolC family protein [Methylophilus sp.]|nr:TolC family protein [Methylophilus sp.]HQQ33181.1 TolC family protein [Methylophilus sp.]